MVCGDRQSFDAYRVHPREDGVHCELIGRLRFEKGNLKILFDQYGNLRAVFPEGPLTDRSREMLKRFSNAYYHLESVERFVPPEQLEAYHATTYVVQGPPQIEIRIGEVPPIQTE